MPAFFGDQLHLYLASQPSGIVSPSESIELGSVRDQFRAASADSP